MKKNFVSAKAVKAIIASAMAVTLAVPSVIMLNNTTAVRADEDDELPQPIAVYNFEDMEKESVTMVENGVAPTIADDAERNSKVLTLGDTLVTEEAVGIVTKEGTNATGEAVVVTEEAVIREQEYAFSEAKVENPFKGRTDLVESPTFNGNSNPMWDKGVTISYWQKATEEDSSVISFSSRMENVLHKDTRDKINIFNLYEKDPDNELFSLGTTEEFEWKIGATYNGIKVVSSLPKKTTYPISVGAGMLVRFNPNYDGKGYYMHLAGDGLTYTLEAIGSAFKKEDYIPVTGKEAVYGTAEGGLQLNASGAWGFLESATTERFQAGVKLDTTDSLNNRNQAAAHTFTMVGEEKTTVDEALTKKASEWHYVTRVITNGCINTYVDGVLKDSELYTNGYNTEIGTVDVKWAFNVGWGYYSMAGEEPMIVMPGKNGGNTIFNMNAAFAIADSKGKYTTNGVLAYNGNTNGLTIMEVLTDENTTLSFGGQTPGMKDCMTYNTETQAGTALDNVAFYDEPLDEDQVAALYEKVSAGEDVGPGSSEEPDSGDTPASAEPGSSDTPASAEPGASAEPQQSKEPVSGEAASAEPVTSQTPSDMLGDVTGDGQIKLDDAQTVLKMALKLKTDATEAQKKAADVNKDNAVDLKDAQLILKRALKLITEF